MTIGHIGNPRPFRLNPLIPGGSRPGKPQALWPWIIKIVADAVIEQWRGAQDAGRVNRRSMPLKLFKRRIDHLLPGWEGYMRETRGHRATPWVRLLKNRQYKGADYSGTSDRGRGHNPHTRANRSKEHWTYQFGPQHELSRLHTRIVRGEITTVADWPQYLGAA